LPKKHSASTSTTSRRTARARRLDDLFVRVRVLQLAPLHAQVFLQDVERHVDGLGVELPQLRAAVIDNPVKIRRRRRALQGCHVLLDAQHLQPRRGFQ
jgi:hypothetical protein